MDEAFHQIYCILRTFHPNVFGLVHWMMTTHGVCLSSPITSYKNIGISQTFEQKYIHLGNILDDVLFFHPETYLLQL